MRGACAANVPKAGRVVVTTRGQDLAVLGDCQREDGGLVPLYTEAILGDEAARGPEADGIEAGGGQALAVRRVSQSHHLAGMRLDDIVLLGGIEAEVPE